MFFFVYGIPSVSSAPFVTFLFMEYRPVYVCFYDIWDPLPLIGTHLSLQFHEGALRLAVAKKSFVWRKTYIAYPVIE